MGTRARMGLRVPQVLDRLQEGREEGASNYVIVTLPGDRTRDRERERNDELVIVACERFPLVSCFRGKP